MSNIQKTLDKFNYQFGQVRGIPDDVEESREIEFVISSEQRDRYDTVLLLDRWELDNYKKNPVVGFNHPFFSWSEAVNKNPDFTIGTGTVTKYLEEKLLIGKVKFEPKEINELADKIFKKIIHGTYKSTSVGFYETKRGDYGKGSEAIGEEKETYYYGGQELLEFSVVEIPANTDATVRFLNDVRDKCPTFVATELEKIKTHSKLGRKQANEAAAELIDLETDLELMKFQTEI